MKAIASRTATVPSGPLPHQLTLLSCIALRSSARHGHIDSRTTGTREPVMTVSTTLHSRARQLKVVGALAAVVLILLMVFGLAGWL